MSVDKYPSIFSRQMATIVYLSLFINFMIYLFCIIVTRNSAAFYRSVTFNIKYGPVLMEM